MPKIHARQEPWIVRLLGGVFSSVPLALAGTFLAISLKIRNRWFRRSLFAASVVFSILSACSFNRLQDLLLVLFLNGTGNPAGGTAVKLGLFYLVYVIVSLPVFLVISYLGSHEKLFKGDSVKRDPGPFRMRYQRHKSSYYQVYLGESFSRTHSLFLTNDQREMHMQVVGSTGTGKTESVLLPMLTHDINHGKGARSKDSQAIIKSHLARWLPQFKEIMAFHSAQGFHGGTGAVYLLLRKSEKAKDRVRERLGLSSGKPEPQVER